MAQRGGSTTRQGAAPGTAYGVDGCPSGWFYFAIAPNGEHCWGIAKCLEQLVSGADKRDRIFVDIPIGLPEGPAEPGSAPDPAK